MKAWLECDACGARGRPASALAVCGHCGCQLSVHYKPQPSPASGPGIFRYAARLPVEDPEHAVSLGEGDTPLVELLGSAASGLGVARVRLKCESMNPTGSFKDRVAAVAATLMRERKIVACVGTSSGNGGAAMAAYARRAGKDFVVFALSDTPNQKMLQIRAAGGTVVVLKGLGYEAKVTAAVTDEIAKHAAANGLATFITASRFAPEAMEGLKTIAYELAEQAPTATVLYVPVGGGGLLSALWRGYSEIAQELPSGPPRLVAVQPSGCPTVRAALGGGRDGLVGVATTAISGLQVAVLFEGHGVLSALRGSGGHLVEVPDEEVFAAQKALVDQEGILVEPAGATALAGAVRDAKTGRLGREDSVVVLATGAGFKDAAALERLAGGTSVRECSMGSIGRVVAAAGGQ